MKKISTAQLKKQFESKYPTVGAKVINGLLRFIDLRVFGTYRDGSGKHVNTHANFSRGFYKKLPKYKLYEHFIHNDCPLFVFYTGRGIWCDNRKHFLLMFDIDNKHGNATDMVAIREHIEQLLNVKFYCNPSTHGNGLHMFAVISFDRNMSISDINLKIAELSDYIRQSCVDKKFNSKFDRICGTVSDVDNLKLGILGKLPNPIDDAGMMALYEAMTVSYPIDEVLPSVEPKMVPNDNKSTTLHIPNNKNMGATSKLKNIKRLEEIKNITETITRRREYAFYLKRHLGRMPTHKELMDGYKMDIDAGEVSSKRAANFEEILEYMASQHDPNKTGWDAAYAKAKSIVAQNNITQQTCDEKYGKQKNRTVLTTDDVAVVLALAMTYTNGVTENVTMTGNYVFAMTKRYKAEGKISKTIDYKKYRACKQILIDNNLIRWAGDFVRGYHATQYVVVSTPNALPEAIRAIPSHSKSEGVATEGVEALNASQSTSRGHDLKTSNHCDGYCECLPNDTLAVNDIHNHLVDTDC